MVAAVAGEVPFAEQIEFFRRKRGVLTESYLDVWEAEHDTAFMIAGANRDDLLADFNVAITRGIVGNATLEDFRRDFDRIVSTHGWDYKGGRNWRSRVIYETNLRQSYNAGRWAQLQALKKSRPWWRYRHSDAVEHPRPEHEAWDGMILHCDDPWWELYFPANGWGCQCYVEALSDRDLKRLGKTGPDKAPPVVWDRVIVGKNSPGGPRIVLTPRGIDPGFAYAPGRSLAGGAPSRGGPATPPSLVRQIERTAETALEKTMRLPALPAAESADRLLQMPRVVRAMNSGFAGFVEEAMQRGQARNETYIVGALRPDIVRALIERHLEPVTAAIVMRDAELLHALRDSKQTASTRRGQPIGLSAQEMARLPGLLADPQAVALDASDGALLYVVDASTRRGAGKIVVSVNYRLKTAGGREIVNSVRTASLLDIAAIASDVRGGILRLLFGEIG